MPGESVGLAVLPWLMLRAATLSARDGAPVLVGDGSAMVTLTIGVIASDISAVQPLAKIFCADDMSTDDRA